jgi:hypothetical protein
MEHISRGVSPKSKSRSILTKSRSPRLYAGTHLEQRHCQYLADAKPVGHLIFLNQSGGQKLDKWFFFLARSILVFPLFLFTLAHPRALSLASFSFLS